MVFTHSQYFDPNINPDTKLHAKLDSHIINRSSIEIDFLNNKLWLKAIHHLREDLPFVLRRMKLWAEYFMN